MRRVHEMTRKGQAANVVMRYAIGILIMSVVIAQIAIPVVQDALVLSTQDVVNETQASSGSVPDVFTVENVGDGLVSGSDTLYFTDSHDSETFKVPAENYTVDYGSGQFNVTEADLNGDGSTDVNSTADSYNVSYTYKPDGYITSATSRTVLGFVVLLLALGLLIVAFRPVMRLMG